MNLNTEYADTRIGTAKAKSSRYFEMHVRFLYYRRRTAIYSYTSLHGPTGVKSNYHNESNY